jgi:hypothetical protein
LQSERDLKKLGSRLVSFVSDLSFGFSPGIFGAFPVNHVVVLPPSAATAGADASSVVAAANPMASSANAALRLACSSVVDLDGATMGANPMVRDNDINSRKQRIVLVEWIGVLVLIEVFDVSWCVMMMDGNERSSAQSDVFELPLVD